MTVHDWLYALNHEIIDKLFEHATDPIGSCCALYNEIKLGTIEVPHKELSLVVIKKRIEEAA
jgi:hypothetical protein